MEYDRSRFQAEMAGALTPELEGAARSQAHQSRLSPPATRRTGGAKKTTGPAAGQKRRPGGTGRGV